jgi:hypothetical protein
VNPLAEIKISGMVRVRHGFPVGDSFGLRRTEREVLREAGLRLAVPPGQRKRSRQICKRARKIWIVSDRAAQARDCKRVLPQHDVSETFLRIEDVEIRIRRTEPHRHRGVFDGLLAKAKHEIGLTQIEIGRNEAWVEPKTVFGLDEGASSARFCAISTRALAWRA